MFCNIKKIGVLGLETTIFILYFIFYFLVLGYWGIYFTYGDVDLLSLPVILFRGIFVDIDISVLLYSAAFFVILPLGLGVVSLFLFKKYNKREERNIPLWVLNLYLIALFGGCFWWCRESIDRAMRFELFCVFAVVSLLIIKRDFRLCNLLYMGCLLLSCVVLWFDWKEGFDKKDKDYDDYFVEPTVELNMSEKRNLIVIFAESFEDRFSKIEKNGKTIKVNDEDGIKFANLVEGKNQGSTIEALTALLQGVYFGEDNEYKKYFLNKDAIRGLKREKENTLVDIDELGIGNIFKHNGYKNIFIKGASVAFLETDKLLMKNGFEREDIYDVESFEGWEEFIAKQKKAWWGPSDKEVLDSFKKKILNVGKKQPFFAVMFTLDLHDNLWPSYGNPYWETDEEIIESTINNFNEFIEWYKSQDFYENTSLVIIGDHRKMGKGRSGAKSKLFNVFFNVPADLKENLNVEKTFNQIDMAPTLLELAGVKLKKRQYGLGFSLFSDNKTIAGSK